MSEQAQGEAEVAKAIRESLESIPKEWHEEFRRFVTTGDASQAFLDYLDADEEARTAADSVFDVQAGVIQMLAKSIHGRLAETEGEGEPIREGQTVPRRAVGHTRARYWIAASATAVACLLIFVPWMVVGRLNALMLAERDFRSDLLAHGAFRPTEKLGEIAQSLQDDLPERVADTLESRIALVNVQGRPPLNVFAADWGLPHEETVRFSGVKHAGADATSDVSLEPAYLHGIDASLGAVPIWYKMLHAVEMAEQWALILLWEEDLLAEAGHADQRIAALVQNKIARAALETDQRKKAEEMYLMAAETAREVGYKFAECQAYSNLGAMYLNRDGKQARQYLKLALAADSSDPVSRYNLICLASIEGNQAEALAEYRGLLECRDRSQDSARRRSIEQLLKGMEGDFDLAAFNRFREGLARQAADVNKGTSSPIEVPKTNVFLVNRSDLPGAIGPVDEFVAEAAAPAMPAEAPDLAPTSPPPPTPVAAPE